MTATPYKRVLTIAGSDSGGGAGIQADLKTFAALGCYGLSVLTALTAQNTVGVRSVFPVTPDFIAEQLAAVLEDIGADAVKIGMLHSAEVVEAVAQSLRQYNLTRVVLDPVMVSKSGSRLLLPSAINSLKHRLFPIVSIVTPNLPEAEILVGRSLPDRKSMEAAAEELLSLCPCIVVKGGHLSGETVADLYASTSGDREWIEYPRIQTRNTHGTGCTYSAAMAAYAAMGYSWIEAVRAARKYLQEAINSGSKKRLGEGSGPVDHAYQLREKTSYK